MDYRGQPGCTEGGQYAGERAEDDRPFFHQMVTNVGDERRRRAAEEIQQVDAASDVLIDPGKAGQVKDEQRAPADAKAADNAGEKADKKSQDIHSSNTARIPP